MSRTSIDFLNTEGRIFSSRQEVTSHISDHVNLSELAGDLNVIGSVSSFKSLEAFLETIESHFTIVQQNGNLLLLNAKEFDVPYYVYWDDDFPIWFTTGRKTEDVPKTFDEYLKSESLMGRLWISKREMENLRQRIIENYPKVLMTYFTARRSRHSDIESIRRPDVDRTFQYYGKDARQTFEEIKYQYGVLPTNLKFVKANDFKFRVTKKGVFTIKHGGIGEVLKVIEDSIERLKSVKEAIDTSEFSIKPNKFVQDTNIPQSRPWAIHLKSEITKQDIDQFEGEELEEWEFMLSDIRTSFESETPSFQIKLIDKRTLGTSVLHSKNGSIRVYPRENTGIDQSFRIFEFVNDQIDPKSYATPVG